MRPLAWIRSMSAAVSARRQARGVVGDERSNARELGIDLGACRRNALGGRGAGRRLERERDGRETARDELVDGHLRDAVVGAIDAGRRRHEHVDVRVERRAAACTARTRCSNAASAGCAASRAGQQAQPRAMSASLRTTAPLRRCGSGHGREQDHQRSPHDASEPRAEVRSIFAAVPSRGNLLLSRAAHGTALTWARCATFASRRRWTWAPMVADREPAARRGAGRGAECRRSCRARPAPAVSRRRHARRSAQDAPAGLPRRSRRAARRSRSAIAVPAWCFRSTRSRPTRPGFAWARARSSAT